MRLDIAQDEVGAELGVESVSGRPLSCAQEDLQVSLRICPRDGLDVWRGIRDARGRQEVCRNDKFLAIMLAWEGVLEFESEVASRR